MNKHVIFLPALLTSAVSLHALSFYIEEPVEIVQESTEVKVSSNLGEEAANQAANPAQSDKMVTIPVDKGNNSKSVKTVVVKTDGKKDNKVVVPVTAANTVVPVTNTVTAASQTITASTVVDPNAGNQAKANIQVASAFIPSKNFNDIVREAKLIGGRVDPFLSMQPPKIEKLPEVPDMVASKPATTDSNFSQPFFPDNTLETKKPQANKKVTNPPDAWVPSFDEKPAKPAKKSGKVKNNKKSNDQIASANAPKNNKPAVKEEDIIIFAPEAKVEEGLELTGIITGSKPMALITVDKENKVYSVGDVIRKDNNTKIVSIDFDTQAITIIDEKNRRAKIAIKD